MLVGGSTRIPMVQKILNNIFPGKELRKAVSLDTVVSEGAALFAAVKAGLIQRNIMIEDVTKTNIGM